MRQIKKGSTDRSVDLYIIDETTGIPETGVVFNAAGMDLKYRRDLSAVVSVTEATLAALTTVHTDGGFLEIGNGVYRFDLPDAAWATGADHVTIFGTVTGMIVLPVTVQLVDHDFEMDIVAVLAAIEAVPAAVGARTPSAQLGAPTTYDGLIYMIRQFVKNKLKYDKALDDMILYEDDGTTPKFAHTMVDDASEATRNAGT